MESDKERNRIALEIDALVIEHCELSREASRNGNQKDYDFHLGFALGAQKALFIVMGYAVCEECNTAYPSDRVQNKDGKLICILCSFSSQ